MKNTLFALTNKKFFYLWLAEVFTQIPVNLLNFLLILVVFSLTKSNTAVSIIVLSFTLPAVFLGIPAGIYVDKWNKKHVLYISNFIRAFLLVIMALFSTNVYVIYIISFLFGIITQFFIPAETPIIPLIVSKDQLLSANALFGIGIFGSILIAYLISGPLLLYLGFVPTIIFMIVMLIIGGLLITYIKVPANEEKKEFTMLKQIPVKEVKYEIAHIIRLVKNTDQILSSLFLLALSQILILVIASVAPGYASEVLHIRIEQFPLLVITPATVGIIVSAIFISNKLQHVRKSKIVTTGIFISGIALILMPYCSKLASRDFIAVINQLLPNFMRITNIDIIVLLAFLLGFANALVFIPSNTLIQEKTSDAVRGKIYGVLNTFVGILSFTPILIVGSFSDLIGVGKVVIGIGISLLVIGIGRVLYNKKK